MIHFHRQGNAVFNKNIGVKIKMFSSLVGRVVECFHEAARSGRRLSRTGRLGLSYQEAVEEFVGEEPQRADDDVAHVVEERHVHDHGFVASSERPTVPDKAHQKHYLVQQLESVQKRTSCKTSVKDRILSFFKACVSTPHSVKVRDKPWGFLLNHAYIYPALFFPCFSFKSKKKKTNSEV